MTKQELKPCPFCGKKRQKVEPMASFGIVNEKSVIDLWCIECKCGGQVIQNSEKSAIAAWNKRVKK